MLYTEIIKDNRDFLSTYRRGRYSASRYSVIYVRPNGRPYTASALPQENLSATPFAETGQRDLSALPTARLR